MSPLSHSTLALDDDGGDDDEEEDDDDNDNNEHRRKQGTVSESVPSDNPDPQRHHQRKITH